MTDIEKKEKMLAEFCRHQGILKGYIFSAIRDYHATEDILQEIAILITKKASDFDFDRPVSPWLTGIAKMYIRRWFQQSVRRPSHISFDMLDQCLTDHSVFEPSEMARRETFLADCLKTLPSTQRRIMSLRYEEGVSCDQVSKMMNRSIQSIYATIKRLKNILRECIDTKHGKDGK